MRTAAAEALGRLGWRATQALPALSKAAQGSRSERASCCHRLVPLSWPVSPTMVTELSSALAGEADPAVKIAMLAALESMAPGSPVILDGHLSTLRDPDASVRKAAATFQKVPLDDSLVSALGTALADANDDVQSAAATSLTAILFENPSVVPTLVNALRDQKLRKAVNSRLIKTTSATPTLVGLNHFRGGTPGSGLGQGGDPAFRCHRLERQGDHIKSLRSAWPIVSFSAKSRNEDIRKSVEPALPIYLQGLDDSEPFVRQEVLSRLDSIPIRRRDCDGPHQVSRAVGPAIRRADDRVCRPRRTVRVRRLRC